MHKSYRYILISIIVLGFVLRLKVCHELLLTDPNVLNPASATDIASYIELARDIARGSYWSPFYLQPFYYAVFLAGIFKFIGANIYNVLLFQSILGALTILFTALAAEILWNKKIAVITALLLVFSQVLNFYTSFLLIVTLQGFWLSLLLYITLLTFKRKKNIYWMYIGIITGCSILTRGNMWLFVPVLFFLIVYNGILQRNSNKGIMTRYMIPIVLLLFFTILPQLPFAYINTKIRGTLSEPSLASKVSFTYGNTMESPPSANDPELGAGIILHNSIQKHWLKTTNQTSITRRIINYITEKPLSYFELTFRKLLLFWDYREIPNNVDINTEKLLSPTLEYFCIITTAVLILFAIPGIFIYLPFISKNNNKFIIPFLFILTYWISISLVINLSRYRAPITPLLAVYAAGFFNFFIFDKISSKRILSCLIMVLISAFIVFFSYDFYRFNFESKVIRFINPRGISVNMGDKTMYLDNGPMVFGSWKLFQLHQGDTIIKEFIPSSATIASDGTFNIPFIAETPIMADVTINGKLFHFKSDKSGKIKMEFNIPISKSCLTNRKNIRLVTVNFKKLTGKLCCIIDEQRNYSRTIINNNSVNAELVCRLFL
jgi:4-amino-4-deoxy-L-arabinose transferase-like glycosyltransferase